MKYKKNTVDILIVFSGLYCHNEPLWLLRFTLPLPNNKDSNLDFQFEGSFEMKKLRQAIMGKNEKNLDDLKGMDGT